MHIGHANCLAAGALVLLTGCVNTAVKIPMLSASAGHPSGETDGKILLNGSNLAASQAYFDRSNRSQVEL